MSTGERTNGADLGIRENWLPLFDRYGVDLVVCGHEHHYERSHPIRGTLPSDTLTPMPVDTRPDVIDTSKGTVHLVIGGGGTSIPSNGDVLPSRDAAVLTGVGQVRSRSKAQGSAHVEEDAPWSAFRDMENPCGFVAFDVDPGQPGGRTSMAATYYAVNGPVRRGTIPVDKFTLTRPRRDGHPQSPSLAGDFGQHHTGSHRGVQRLRRPCHRDGHHDIAVLPHQS